jgi:hypothetical protein
MQQAFAASTRQVRGAPTGFHCRVFELTASMFYTRASQARNSAFFSSANGA